MQRVSGGYTIVEVIIVLGVSSLLILLSITFLSGRDGQVRFSQSMRDMQSKMQDWVNDVTTGFPTGTDTAYNCKAGAASSPAIDSTPRNPDDSPECIFLGKAIQFVDGSGTVYAYPVFGRRLDAAGGLSSNLKDASPMPAIGSGAGVPTGTAQLTEEYQLNGNAKVKSASSSTTGSLTSHMAGYYLSLANDTSGSQDGASQLKAYQYPLSAAAPKSVTVADCINMKAAGVCPLGVGLNEPTAMADWKICFNNDANSDTALLTVSGGKNGFGATTKLEYTPC